MALEPGRSLSFYELVAPLGAGGMGEVWRARDTRLDRQVAIKVLPEHFADDEDRLRRFEREARVLASLTHPNIAGVYGIDQVDHTCFIAMELVEGEDLAERLKRGPLPLDEALELTRQVAEGLEAAHEAGLVHRDLKPANVRVTPEGTAKLLDFGLAKPVRGVGSDGRTRGPSEDSLVSTEEGTVLGTPTYMAPEQARGRPVDRRVDVWAFGCVLYECLAARRAFGGESFTDVLAAIAGEEPDWSALPAVPARVAELLRRCLEKDPRRRLRDIGEARVLLEAVDPRVPEPRAEPSGERGRRGPLGGSLLGVAGLAAGVALGALALRPASTGASAEGAREALSIHVPETSVLAAARLPNLTCSNDARRVAWVGGDREEIHVRSLDSYETRVLVGTEGSGCPVFSPDGTELAFVQGGVLRRIGVDGGKPTEITRLGDYGGSTQSFRGVTWSDDGWIVFSPSFATGLRRVRAEGGEPEDFAELDPALDARTLRWPHAPAGTDVVFFTRDDSASQDYYDDAVIVARSTSTGDERVVLRGASMARYAAGQLVHARGGELFTVAFDLDTLTTVGDPRRIVAGLEVDGSSGAAQFAVASDGTLVHCAGGVRETSLRLAWKDRVSSEWVELPPGSYRYPRLSPDGRRLAYVLAEPDASSAWVHDFERGTSTPQMRRGDAVGICWSPDGRRLYFGSAVDGPSDAGVFALEVDGGRDPELVARIESAFLAPVGFLPDGRLSCRASRLSEGTAFVAVDVESGEAEELLRMTTEDRGLALHPGGEWVAYSSNRSGRFEIYLEPLGTGPILPRVSKSGGLDPAWSDDGRTLYYVSPGDPRLWAVEVELDDTPELGVPVPVLDDFFHRASVEYTYDIGPDGRILTVVDTVEAELGRDLRVQPRFLAGL